MVDGKHLFGLLSLSLSLCFFSVLLSLCFSLFFSLHLSFCFSLCVCILISVSLFLSFPHPFLLNTYRGDVVDRAIWVRCGVLASLKPHYLSFRSPEPLEPTWELFHSFASPYPHPPVARNCVQTERVWNWKMKTSALQARRNRKVNLVLTISNYCF